MAIDFTLTPTATRASARSPANLPKTCLRTPAAAELLATPEERFLATKPIYEAMVAAGYLRKCIPCAGRRRECRPGRHGHHGRGILQREPERHPDDAGNGSRSVADPARRHAGTVWATAGAVPEEERRTAGRTSAPVNPAAAPMRRHRRPVRASAPPPSVQGDNWIINGRKKWVSSATGWDRKGAEVLMRGVPNPILRHRRTRALSIIAVEAPAPGIVFERAINSDWSPRASGAAIRLPECLHAAS